MSIFFCLVSRVQSSLSLPSPTSIPNLNFKTNLNKLKSDLNLILLESAPIQGLPSMPTATQSTVIPWTPLPFYLLCDPSCHRYSQHILLMFAFCWGWVRHCPFLLLTGSRCRHCHVKCCVDCRYESRIIVCNTPHHAVRAVQCVQSCDNLKSSTRFVRQTGLFCSILFSVLSIDISVLSLSALMVLFSSSAPLMQQPVSK